MAPAHALPLIVETVNRVARKPPRIPIIQPKSTHDDDDTTPSVPSPNPIVPVHLPPTTATMRAGLLPLAAALSSVANALHFYVDPDAGPKCFFEELPHDTLVVGHYKAEQWDNTLQSWQSNDMTSVYISVDVRPPSPPPTKT